MKYYPPSYGANDFHCPICSVYAHQQWAKLTYGLHGSRYDTKASISICGHCGEPAYWYGQKLIVPGTSPVEMPSADLPEDCRSDYMEAREIVSLSPKGAVALLRLCVQKLMVHLGESGKNINSDIANLVKAGLPPLIQKSLDICRVVGNNAVHPGEIIIDDTPEIAHSLFRLINVIVEDRISRPKHIEALYGALPEGAREAIEKRDEA
ncbi:DUF4145 domain-containing protein [Methylomonas sp. HW2-6]|uniref:DUF4145 domain-containing protein n=1 Tax=Methylomonas sp. HW2-6 TaxID=3376687 RepID=UPI00404174CE